MSYGLGWSLGRVLDIVWVRVGHGLGFGVELG